MCRRRTSSLCLYHLSGSSLMKTKVRLIPELLLQSDDPWLQRKWGQVAVGFADIRITRYKNASNESIQKQPHDFHYPYENSQSSPSSFDSTYDRLIAKHIQSFGILEVFRSVPLKVNSGESTSSYIFVYSTTEQFMVVRPSGYTRYLNTARIHIFSFPPPPQSSLNRIRWRRRDLVPLFAKKVLPNYHQHDVIHVSHEFPRVATVKSIFSTARETFNRCTKYKEVETAAELKDVFRSRGTLGLGAEERNGGKVLNALPMLFPP